MPELRAPLVAAVYFAVSPQRQPRVASEFLLSYAEHWPDFVSLSAQWANKYPKFPPLKLESWERAERTVAESLDKEIAIIPIFDVRYPATLRNIDDPPPVLFVKGSIDALNERYRVAIVGTRKASQTGVSIAKRLAAFLVGEGWAIVSGLALGIDTAAHRGTISAGGRAVAVLAHGLHTIAPPTNKLLSDEIVSTGGCLVTEYPIGLPPRPEQFVQRNRIQIGLSYGSIIVEADAKSGSMQQARFCVRDKRVLFAVVPNDAENRLALRSEGTLLMVKELGAVAIHSKDDYPQVVEKLLAKKDDLDRLASVRHIETYQPMRRFGSPS